MDQIYLDHNATTRPCPEAIEAMTRAAGEWWQNPSSAHRPGQAVRAAVDGARDQVAALLGARGRDITFTAGGTESIHLAIRGTLGAARGRRVIVTTPVEHEAIRELCEHLERAGEIEVVHLDCSAGRVDPAALAAALDERADEVALVSVQWANNETGVIQPIEALATICRERGVVFHTDATQWVGKMATDVASAPIDLLTCSAHKFHGPKGVGCLFARPGVRLAPMFLGSQERERRAGTENVPGILGMGAAAEAAARWLADPSGPERVGALRDRFERGVAAGAPGAVVNGAGLPRLWNTASIGFESLGAEALLLGLSERGVAASAGAACSSGSLEPSPVLLAMGIPETVAHGTLRFSLSRETTDAEIDAAIPIVVEAARRLAGLGVGSG
jgi:cysteine desulfurase